MRLITRDMGGHYYLVQDPAEVIRGKDVEAIREKDAEEGDLRRENNNKHNNMRLGL